MRSIKSSIVYSFAAALLLAGTIGLVAAIVVVRERTLAQFDRGLRVKAEAVASLIEMDDDGLELDERDQALGEFQGRADASYFELRDVNGRTIEKSITLAAPLPVPLPEAIEFVTGPATLPDGRPGRIGLLPIVIGPDGEDPRPARDAGEDETPTAWVVVAADTADVSTAMRDIGAILAVAVALVAGVVLLVIPRLVDRGLEPLRRLTAWTARIDPKNLSDRFPADRLPAELAPIVTQLNASLDRINQAFDRERRFAAGAAHELRTPLAAIRTNAEVALRWPDPAGSIAALQSTLRSAERMQRLIERLLELARLGQQTARTLEPFDVHAVVRSALASEADVLANRRLTVDINVPTSLMLHSDAELLQPLIDNVISNAARYAVEGSTVRITAKASARRLVIANRTDDLTADHLPHLFEPLWTQSADRGQGTGLGLALVAEYAQILRITIEPSLTPDGEFRQTLTFPA